MEHRDVDGFPTDWSQLQQWWQAMGRRLQVEDRAEAFFRRALGVSQALAGVVQVGGEVEYILFVLVRYWIPVVLPPPGRERTSKGDPDYWLESADSEGSRHPVEGTQAAD